MTDSMLDPATEIVFSGIDGTTGGPATPPLTLAQLAAAAGGETLDADELAKLQARVGRQTTETLGAVEGVDTEDLAQAGWAVIFPADVNPAIQGALAPLLRLRRDQAAATKSGRYREFVGDDGYRKGETARQFLVRHGVGPAAPADPDRLPYYVLLVGGPDQIPFEFQYQLDVTYAVGRLALDGAAAVARYAQSVVAREDKAPSARELVFFGPKNPDDPATTLSADHLLAPLAAHLGSMTGGWTVRSQLADEATKANLRALLGESHPAILMTAGHGMVFPDGHPRQATDQGGLLCQNWPGPASWHQAIPDDFYLRADDLPVDHGAEGMIALFFACYGAGTPQFDDFLTSGGAPKQIAPGPFMARLPSALLAHPAGPALAVVGHVERAMSYSFAWPGVGEEISAFESVISALTKGRRLGGALEYMNDRYAALSVQLDAAREDARYGQPTDPTEIAGLWTARNDARNYVTLGDPAVRAPLGSAL